MVRRPVYAWRFCGSKSSSMARTSSQRPALYRILHTANREGVRAQKYKQGITLTDRIDLPRDLSNNLLRFAVSVERLWVSIFRCRAVWCADAGSSSPVEQPPVGSARMLSINRRDEPCSLLVACSTKYSLLNLVKISPASGDNHTTIRDRRPALEPPGDAKQSGQ